MNTMLHVYQLFNGFFAFMWLFSTVQYMRMTYLLSINPHSALRFRSHHLMLGSQSNFYDMLKTVMQHSK